MVLVGEGQGMQIHLQVRGSTNQEGPLPAHCHQVASQSQGKAYHLEMHGLMCCLTQKGPLGKKFPNSQDQLRSDQETVKLGGRGVILEFRSPFTLQT